MSYGWEKEGLSLSLVCFSGDLLIFGPTNMI